MPAPLAAKIRIEDPMISAPMMTATAVRADDRSMAVAKRAISSLFTVRESSPSSAARRMRRTSKGA